MQQFQNNLEQQIAEAALESVEKAPEEMREQTLHAAFQPGVGKRRRSARETNYQRAHQQSLSAQPGFGQHSTAGALPVDVEGKTEEALRAIAALRTPRDRAVMLGQIAGRLGRDKSARPR
jgi:hypothetical protein